ncbi:MAG: ABC transporter permease [Candidatus Cryosericum sp.]|nr:ABC transporter permease [Candidatus Cryosericum sp.]HPS69281.1 ABC transporter permease [Candidatus Cryosericum sp.]
MSAQTQWQTPGEGHELEAGAFGPTPSVTGSLQEIGGRPTTYWNDAIRRIRHNKLAVAGLWIISFLLVVAVIGPMLSPYSYEQQDLNNTYQSPTLQHPFGTDQLGRDQLTRVMYGSRISLAVGIVCAALNFIIGVTYGGIAAYFGGKVDEIMMRIVDILYGIPTLIIVILLTVLFKDKGVNPLVNVFIAIGLTYWLPMARIVRGEILSLKEREFALAAKTIGAPNSRILFRHLIPNAMGAIIVTVTLEIPSAIFTEAFLSYIGLGVSAPVASWGSLASDGTEAIRSFPYLVVFPALAISLTMFAFNFLGDGLRDALDPRLRQ